MGRSTPRGTVLLAVAAAMVLGVASCRADAQQEATASSTPSPSSAAPAADQHGEHGGSGSEHSGHSHSETGRGLTAVQNGYRLEGLRNPAAAGQRGELSFRIAGPSGAPQTRFKEAHTKLMHVFVVREDLTDFYHVHPSMAPDGTWSTPLTLRNPGPYRLVTDFVALDEQNQPNPLVLGIDFTVAGPYEPQPLPAPTRETSVDGFTVRVDGDLVAGQASMMTVRISRGGAPVTDLRPYLGAMAHIAAFHEGVLEVVHMHPQDAPSDGGSPSELMVHAEFPAAGLYRMFIQFQTGDQLHTAPITVAVQ